MGRDGKTSPERRPCATGRKFDVSLSDLTALLERLPPELRQEVFDFASYLAEKKTVRHTSGTHKRVPGLQAGQLTPSDDFDEPLPDDFWLGRER